MIGNDNKEQELLNCYLAKEFDIKTLGRLKYFLQIELSHSKYDIFISQHKYIANIHKEIDKAACKLVGL